MRTKNILTVRDYNKCVNNLEEVTKINIMLDGEMTTLSIERNLVWKLGLKGKQETSTIKDVGNSI